MTHLFEIIMKQILEANVKEVLLVPGAMRAFSSNLDIECVKTTSILNESTEVVLGIYIQ